MNNTGITAFGAATYNQTDNLPMKLEDYLLAVMGPKQMDDHLVLVLVTVCYMIIFISGLHAHTAIWQVGVGKPCRVFCFFRHVSVVITATHILTCRQSPTSTLWVGSGVEMQCFFPNLSWSELGYKDMCLYCDDSINDGSTVVHV